MHLLHTRNTRTVAHSLHQSSYDLRIPIKPIYLSLILASTLVTADEAKPTCFDNADTQQEINQCSGLDNQTADQALNSTYQAILKQHANDKPFIDSLKQAQRAWLKWRDAEMLAIYPIREQPGYYGSSFKACWHEQIASMTRERTRQLKKWLDGVEEGDMCSGSFPIKPIQPALPEAP
ncbi:MAG: DUF1311 domain-containing protein [Methylomonas sp.]|jgi:uncharacterized protein YecT (DUF1311 family)|uniref:lysozyme inhibitor LprI family protein n=1 Tax=Methylomonas sp. TaxID=418 RepID=UPI0025F411C8|nr:lysozyme inhibitor LprI family protein [Methylomonas sp.]MCK9608588.1 DUF1311 domain-containing protein [Methylomonas sp.]